jgi:hypothetical protein
MLQKHPSRRVFALHFPRGEFNDITVNAGAVASRTIFLLRSGMVRQM